MAGFLKVSDAASLALHATAILAKTPGKLLSTPEIASILRASNAHLSKVLQRLTKAGLVTARRGPAGGYELTRPARRITLLEVYEAIEGRHEPTSCLFERPVCSGRCILGNLLKTVDTQVANQLANTTLADLRLSFNALKQIVRRKAEG